MRNGERTNGAGGVGLGSHRTHQSTVTWSSVEKDREDEGGAAAGRAGHFHTFSPPTPHHPQLRIHTTERCDLYVHTVSGPIIEDCSALRFAPYALRYAGLEADMAVRFFFSVVMLLLWWWWWWLW